MASAAALALGFTLGLPVAGPLGFPVTAAQAQVVALQDLTFGTPDKVQLRIPRLEVEGGNKTEAEIRAVFAAASFAEVRAFIESLSARAIKVPEIILEGKGPEGSLRMSYKDIALTNIDKGVVGRTVIAGQTIDAKPKDGPGLAGSVGTGMIEMLDLGAYFALFDKAPPGDNPPRTLLGAASIDSMSFTDGANFTMRVGKVSTGRYTVKPSGEGLGALLQLAQSPDLDKLPPEEAFKRLLPVLDMVQGLEFGTVEYRDFSVDVNAPELKGRVRMGVERVAVTGNPIGQKMAVKLTNASLDMPDGKVSLGSYESEGFSYAPTMKALRKMATGIKPEAIDPREWVPELGRYAVKDLKADVPDPDNPKTRIQMSMAGFSVDVGPQRNGIPTGLRIALENLAITLPRNNPEVKPLLDMGLTKLDLGMEIDAVWQESSASVEVKTITFTGADLGTVTLTGKFGGLPATIFAAKPEDAMMMLLGATATEVSVSYEDDGLIDKFVAQQAKEQKSTPKQVRELMAGMAAVVVPEPFASTDAGQELVEALSGMVRDPGSVTVTATAKNGKGIPVMQLAGAEDPMKLLEMVDITVETE